MMHSSLIRVRRNLWNNTSFYGRARLCSAFAGRQIGGISDLSDHFRGRTPWHSHRWANIGLVLIGALSRFSTHWPMNSNPKCSLCFRGPSPTVTAHQVAISVWPEALFLRFPIEMAASIRPCKDRHSAGSDSHPHCRRSCRRLDDLHMPDRVAFIKVDVEGHEEAVLFVQPSCCASINPSSWSRPKNAITQMRYKACPRHFSAAVTPVCSSRGQVLPVSDFVSSKHQVLNDRPPDDSYANNFVFAARDPGMIRSSLEDAVLRRKPS